MDTTDNPSSYDDDELERREAQFNQRNSTLQHVIDILAGYEPADLDEFGAKSELAREHNIERHRIDYVLNHWPGLVHYRRHCNRDPLEPEAVKAAYDDPTMQALAGASAEAVADGAGNINVDVTLSLDEAFRAIKLLPGDLGLKVFGQVMSSDLPRSEIQAILNRD